MRLGFFIMAEFTEFTGKKRRFLELFAKIGTVTHAAEGSGISRQSVWIWKKEDEAFARAMAGAEEQRIDALEKRAFQRAEEGSDVMLIFLLKSLRPKRYREQVTHQHSGEVVSRFDLSNIDTDEIRTLRGILSKASSKPIANA